MTSEDTIECIWKAANETMESEDGESVHPKALNGLCGAGVDLVLKNSVASKTMDNITTVIIGFEKSI
jgi:hypothetical protein